MRTNITKRTRPKSTRQFLRGVLAIFLLSVLALVGLAQAGTITVGLGAGYDFGTIQTGIDAAKGGDTVGVCQMLFLTATPREFSVNAYFNNRTSVNGKEVQ